MLARFRVPGNTAAASGTPGTEVALPLAETTVDAQKSEFFSTKGGDFPAPQILIVDDERLIRWSLRESLFRNHYRVLEAEDAKGALQCFAQGGDEIDLVLLDLKLPDSDDLSLLKQIKQVRPQCQIILMTAYGTPETADDARRNGAYLVLNKPFNIDQLVGVIAQALENRPH